MSGFVFTEPKVIDLIKTLSETPHGAAINGSGVGVGKTATAVQVALNRLAKEGHTADSGRVLIIAPPNTLDGWASTVYWLTGQKLRVVANQGARFTFTPDPDNRKRTVTVKLSKSENQESLRAATVTGEAGWFFVGREMFVRLDYEKRPKMVKGRDNNLVQRVDTKTGKPVFETVRLGIWGEKSRRNRWGVVVYDECQKVAAGSSRGNRSWHYSVGADFKLAQSADWFGNRLENMYSVARATFGRDLIPYNLGEFKHRFMETKYNHFVHDNLEVVGEKVAGEFANSLPCYVALPPGVEQPDPQIVYVDLGREQRAVYDELENLMAVELPKLVDGGYGWSVADEEAFMSLDLPLLLKTRLRELTLGVFGVTGYREGASGGVFAEVDFSFDAPSAKADMLRELMSDYPSEPFLVFTHSRKFAHALVERARRVWGVTADAFTGDVSRVERDRVKGRFLGGESRLLVATTAIAEGVDGLQRVCRNLVMLSEDWNELQNRQVVGRLARVGQDRQVNVWKVLARDTVDVEVFGRLLRTALVNARAKVVDKRDSKV